MDLPGPVCNSIAVPSIFHHGMELTSARDATREPESEHEAALVQRAKARDSETWSEIYHLYYRPVFRYFLGRFGDAHTCEDLAATVFLQAVKGIDSFVYKGTPFLAWLYRIARNVAADHYRNELGRRPSGAAGMRPRIPAFLRRNSDAGEPGDEGAARDELANAAISVERLDLKNAMQRLSKSQREIIALHYYAGFSLREVARILGINERRVYSAQARALVELRRQLI